MAVHYLSDGRSYVDISVRDLQKGLTVAQRRDPSIFSPGRIDGLWGPQTNDALTSWGSLQPRSMGSTSPVTTPTPRATQIQLFYPAYVAIMELRRAYVEPSTSSSPTPAQVVSSASAPSQAVAGAVINSSPPSIPQPAAANAAANANPPPPGLLSPSAASQVAQAGGAALASTAGKTALIAIGIGLGALVLGGVAYYLLTHKKTKRRRR